MKKIFYEKVGRRYKPVSEYDSELVDAFQKGTHLVMVYPGGASRRYNVDPNYAALIAASRVARDPMHQAINEATKMHRDQYEGYILEPAQQKAWEHFVEVMGERGRILHYDSVHDIADAGLRALEEEAAKLMEHESVKQAYEQFLLVCKLTKSQENSWLSPEPLL